VPPRRELRRLGRGQAPAPSDTCPQAGWHYSPSSSDEEWATESLLTARVAYTDPATGQRIKPGAKLGDKYQEANLPVVRWRMYKAGIRLAMVLNEVFSEK
jgi:S1/P1 Nuclease